MDTLTHVVSQRPPSPELQLVFPEKALSAWPGSPAVGGGGTAPRPPCLRPTSQLSNDGPCLARSGGPADGGLALAMQTTHTVAQTRTPTYTNATWYKSQTNAELFRGEMRTEVPAFTVRC